MFKVMELNWHKRRPATDSDSNTIDDVDVIDFREIDGHACLVRATVNGVALELDGRVYSRESYEMQPDGSTRVIRYGWGVQGTNHEGVSVVLRSET